MELIDIKKSEEFAKEFINKAQALADKYEDKIKVYEYDNRGTAKKMLFIYFDKLELASPTLNLFVMINFDGTVEIELNYRLIEGIDLRVLGIMNHVFNVDVDVPNKIASIDLKDTNEALEYLEMYFKSIKEFDKTWM